MSGLKLWAVLTLVLDLVASTAAWLADSPHPAGFLVGFFAVYAASGAGLLVASRATWQKAVASALQKRTT
jgi:hypothetical protein